MLFKLDSERTRREKGGLDGQQQKPGTSGGKTPAGSGEGGGSVGPGLAGGGKTTPEANKGESIRGDQPSSSTDGAAQGKRVGSP
ncbi:MAG: hypothetical protein SGI77_00630 [Pirellulaceae bacterium]|nr:hypothetical protein [Pirellulaceae bacterium]